jgi:tetratricopeptide (TPR) repeat protein
MRISFQIPIVTLAAALFSAISLAQEPAPAKPAGEQPAPAKPADTAPASPSSPSASSKGPPQTYPQRYQLLIVEAMDRFQARDFKGALKYADKADEILPPTIWSLNIRGAIAIEQRDFVNGAKYCKDALRLDPDFFPARFNLCEIPFLQEKYAEARALWNRMYDETKKDDPTIELLAYRIFLTYLLEKDFDHAKEWMGKIPFPSQTAAYHYANAAWERQHGNMAKWDEWLQSAAFVWDEAKRSAFTDVLIQLGWMKRE